MKRTTYASLLALGLASALGAQTKDTVLFTNRYHSDSLDTGAKILTLIRGQDIAAVTPGNGATAHSVIPVPAWHAMLGDADKDGDVTFYAGLNAYTVGTTGPFIKYTDLVKGFDPSVMYWGIKKGSASAKGPVVWANGQAHEMRTGDFVRFLPTGQVEFFITQDQIMKAAGNQTGSWINGAGCILQDKDGNIYYSGPNEGANGHWVDNGGNRAFLYDGGLAIIPKDAITYDANGNVQDVKAASVRVVFNEIGGSATNPSTRDMCTNSAAIDSLGNPTIITFNCFFALDPAGGEFTGWDGQKHPNFLFTSPRNALTSTECWYGTIYTTQVRNGQLGDIATINGVLCGSRDPNNPPDGSWLGLKKTSANSTYAPLIHGFATIKTDWNETAPYGTATLDADKEGIFTIGTDPTIDLAVQGPSARFPVAALSLGAGVGNGGFQPAIDLAAQFSHFMWFYPPSAAWIAFPGGSTDSKGQVSYSFTTPNDPKLKGANIVMQALCAKIGGGLLLSNPINLALK